MRSDARGEEAILAGRAAQTETLFLPERGGNLMPHDSQGVKHRDDRRAGSQDVTESEKFGVSSFDARVGPLFALMFRRGNSDAHCAFDAVYPLNGDSQWKTSDMM